MFDHLSRSFGVDESQVRQICGTASKTEFAGSYSSDDNNFYLDMERLKALLSLLDE